jgi:hypothetical protein
MVVFDGCAAVAAVHLAGMAGVGSWVIVHWREHEWLSILACRALLAVNSLLLGVSSDTVGSIFILLLHACGSLWIGPPCLWCWWYQPQQCFWSLSSAWLLYSAATYWPWLCCHIVSGGIHTLEGGGHMLLDTKQCTSVLVTTLPVARINSSMPDWE